MIVILTGAGASVPFGYPTTTQFFDDFEPSGRQKLIFNYLKNYLHDQVLDVEIALEILDASRSFLSTAAGEFLSQGLGEHWRNDVLELCAALKARCFEKYGADVDKSKVEALYTPLLEACSWRDGLTSLYTTNYDPVPDALMAVCLERKVKPYDGFQPSVSHWEPDGYKKVDKGLRLYRLHGSMSWVQRLDGTVINTRDYSARSGGNHLLIYPGYKGNPELNATPMAFAHRALQEELTGCDVMISIGFAHRDPHLQRLLDTRAVTSPRLKLIVLNPILPNDLSTELDIRHIALPFGHNDVRDELVKALAA